MRKLFRQAMVFGLSGFLVTFVGFFAILGANITTNARANATAAVHAEIDPPGTHLPLGARARPTDTVDVPLTNGTILHVRECQQYWRGRLDETTDCRFFSDRYRELAFVPLGHAQQIAVEKDYRSAYRKSIRENLLQNEFCSTTLALRWGFLGGLGVWILYRLIRCFAVR
jgi:hypothetical protein